MFKLSFPPIRSNKKNIDDAKTLLVSKTTIKNVEKTFFQKIIVKWNYEVA